MPARKKMSESERAEWVRDMREILVKSSTDKNGRPVVNLVLRHVTRSGMSRSISAFTIVEGDPYVLDYRISKILGWSTDQRNGGVKVSGVGMDMGFHLVYSLACVVAPPRGPENPAYVNGRKVEDPGYNLSHRWL